MGQVLDIQTARHQVALAENGGAGRDAVEAAYADLRDAMLAVETPAQKINRLLVEARDLDAQFDRFMREVDTLDWRIEGCRQADNAEQALMLEGQRKATIICANQAADKSLRIKLDRAALILEQDQRLVAMAGE